MKKEIRDYSQFIKEQCTIEIQVFSSSLLLVELIRKGITSRVIFANILYFVLYINCLLFPE